MTAALEYKPKVASRSVWVFHLDIDPSEIAAWRHEVFLDDDDASTIWPLRDALGLTRLDNDFTEVIEAADFKTYRLDRYLHEANGFDEDAVTQDAAVLNALKGVVALIYSEALGSDPVTLAPEAPLRFVGRYDTKPDMRLPNAIRTDSTEGELVAKSPAPATGRPPLAAALIFAVIVLGLFTVLFLAKTGSG